MSNLKDTTLIISIIWSLQTPYTPKACNIYVELQNFNFVSIQQGIIELNIQDLNCFWEKIRIVRVHNTASGVTAIPKLYEFTNMMSFSM